MTDAELYTLIQSDPDAKHRAEIGDDSGCAERCSVIAPVVRKPVAAATSANRVRQVVQEIEIVTQRDTAE